MEPMDRVTFVQGMFCGVLVAIVGASIFGPGHHAAVSHVTAEDATPSPAAEVRHPQVTPVVHPVAEARVYDLNWSGYNGTGDAAKAVYTLAGKPLGTGEAGLKALREAITQLPAGSTVRVRPSYSREEENGVLRSYPFDVNQLKHFADEHHVTLAMPSAG